MTGKPREPDEEQSLDHELPQPPQQQMLDDGSQASGDNLGEGDEGDGTSFANIRP